MVFTNQGKSRVALMVGSLASNRPQWCGIGSGSITEAATVTGLSNVFDRRQFTSTDVSGAGSITWITDFDAVAMSGNTLQEVDLSAGSPADGEIFLYGNLGNTFTFDGTKELRVEITWVNY